MATHLVASSNAQPPTSLLGLANPYLRRSSQIFRRLSLAYLRLKPSSLALALPAAKGAALKITTSIQRRMARWRQRPTTPVVYWADFQTVCHLSSGLASSRQRQ